MNLSTYEIIFVEATVDTAIPQKAVIWADTATVPPGWTIHTASANRLMKGAPAGSNAGATYGSNSHTHTASSHTHSSPHTHGNIPLNPFGYTRGIAILGIGNPSIYCAPNPHGHPAIVVGTQTVVTPADTAGASSSTALPPYYELLAYKADNDDAPLFSGMIVATLLNPASVPAGWSICDGTNGTPNLQGTYIRTVTSPPTGGTGGSATHTHTIEPHIHTGSADHIHPGLSGDSPPGYLANADNSGYVQTHKHAVGPALAPIGSVSAPGLSAASSSLPSSKAVLFLRKD